MSLSGASAELLPLDEVTTLLGLRGVLDLWPNLVTVKKVGAFFENKKVELKGLFEKVRLVGVIVKGEKRLEVAMVLENKGFCFAFPVSTGKARS